MTCNCKLQLSVGCPADVVHPLSIRRLSVVCHLYVNFSISETAAFYVFNIAHTGQCIRTLTFCDRIVLSLPFSEGVRKNREKTPKRCLPWSRSSALTAKPQRKKLKKEKQSYQKWKVVIYVTYIRMIIVSDTNSGLGFELWLVTLENFVQEYIWTALTTHVICS